MITQNVLSLLKALATTNSANDKYKLISTFFLTENEERGITKEQLLEVLKVYEQIADKQKQQGVKARLQRQDIKIETKKLAKTNQKEKLLYFVGTADGKRNKCIGCGEILNKGESCFGLNIEGKWINFHPIDHTGHCWAPYDQKFDFEGVRTVGMNYKKKSEEK